MIQSHSLYQLSYPAALARYYHSPRGASTAGGWSWGHGMPCPYFFFWAFSIFAQVSRRVAVRLKQSFCGVESGSTQK